MTIDITGPFMDARGVDPMRAGTVRFWVWFAALVPPVVLMAFIAYQPWIDPGDLLRDPLAVAEMKQECCKVYYGAVSNLGVMTWIGSAVVCLFAASVLATAGGRPADVSFLMAAGLFTGFLAMDDLFLVHENVLPAFGVSEPVTYAAYALLGLAYLIASWRPISDSHYILFAVACGFLATSVMVDWQVHSDHRLRIVLEDGAKLIGISAWATFHLAAAWSLLRNGLAQTRHVSFG